jgi:hypothetical protein
MERTYGRWLKAGWKVTAPPEPDGNLVILLRSGFGLIEMDGISVRPVSDRQNDSLTIFLEATTLEAP